MLEYIIAYIAKQSLAQTICQLLVMSYRMLFRLYSRKEKAVYCVKYTSSNFSYSPWDLD